MKFEKKNATQLLSIAMALGLSLSAHADFGISVDISKNSDYKTPDKELDFLLGLEYRGDKFNIAKETISYDFTDSNKYAVEMLLASKNYGYEASDSKTLIGMAKRHPSIDIGGRIIVDTGLGPAVFDITKDIHSSKGYQASIKLGGITPHASHNRTGERKINIAAAAGLRYQSSKVVDYYYGVKNSEATSNRKAYKGKSATTPFIGVEAQANLTPHITLTGGFGFEKTARSIKNSPLSNAKKYQPMVNLGFAYWF